MSHSWGDVPESDEEFLRIGSTTGRLIANDEMYDPYSGQPRMSNVPVSIVRSSLSEVLATKAAAG